MAGDVTVGFLKRMSKIPDNHDVGNLIAGQDYWDVYFTGGTASNLIITNSTITPTRRVVTAAGAITVASTDDIIFVKKTVGEATTVNINVALTAKTFWIKDAKGDAAVNNITISPSSGTIDGETVFVMDRAYQSIGLVWNGSEFSKL